MNLSHLRLQLAVRVRAYQHLPTSIRSFSKYSIEGDEAEFEAARQWFRSFSKSPLPNRLATTTFSRSSGPGGQKTNKTSSKATTNWPWSALAPHIPPVILQELKSSRYYVSSSNSISIQCDTHRGQTDNEEENHRRLHDEISQIYRRKVPGVTSQDTRAKHEAFLKASNAQRLKTKKLHSNKKQSRRGGGGDD